MTWPLSGSKAGVDFVLSVPAERILKWEVGVEGGRNVTSYFPIFNKNLLFVVVAETRKRELPCQMTQCI